MDGGPHFASTRMICDFCEEQERIAEIEMLLVLNDPVGGG
jgi:hypothetical protein